MSQNESPSDGLHRNWHRRQKGCPPYPWPPWQRWHQEKKCLRELAELGLLDEVINVIGLYTFNKVDSANLNEKYALKLGNDFSYKEIRSAEAAVEALREGRKPAAKKAESHVSPSSNIPIWSNPDYKEETSEEDLAQLEKIQQEILAKLEKGE